MKTPLPPGASSPFFSASRILLAAASACLGSAAHGQTLAEALETGSRVWSVAGGPDAVTPVPWPGGSGDSADRVILTGSGGQPASLSTEVERPFVLRWSGAGVTLSVDGALIDPGAFEKEPDAASGLTVFRYQESGMGTGGEPVTVTFSAEAGALDAVRIFVPLSEANAPGKRVGTNPVWTLHERTLSWLINPDDPAGPTVLIGSILGESYAEALVTGPVSFTSPAGSRLYLPDMGRTVFSGVPFPGPHRVFFYPDQQDRKGWRLPQITPAVPLAAATGAPDLPWETGGAVPWVGVAGPDGLPASAQSGGIGQGEESWIQVTVTGPGVLRWLPDKDSPHGFSLNGLRTAEPGFDRGACYLHLPAGAHRVRWWAHTTQNSLPVILRDVGYEPAPSPSWQEVTGLPDMAYFAVAVGPPPVGVPAWSTLNVWTPATADGRSGVRMERSVDMIPVLPSPGEYDLTTLVRDLNPPSPNPQQEHHTWRPLTLRAPRGERPFHRLVGPYYDETLVTASAWRPAADVSLAEALDTPDLVWTTGSGEGKASVWRGYSGNSAGTDSDPDAAHFRSADAYPEAWMEARITGPVRADIHWSRSSPAEIAPPDLGFQVLIDGSLALKTPPYSELTSPADPLMYVHSVNVPAGEHTVRFHWAPGAAGSSLLPVISRVVLTPLEAGPDIGALVEAPDLPWLETGLRVSSAETADTSDGVDAARLTVTPGETPPALTTTVTGPGTFTARIKGIIMDPDGPYTAGWVEEHEGYRLKGGFLPPGRASIRFYPFALASGLVDTVRWEPLPALTAERARAILTPAAGSPLPFSLEGRATYTGYPAENPDSIVVPGNGYPVTLVVPKECRINFSARFLPVAEGEPAGSALAGGWPVIASTDKWTTNTVNTDWAGGGSVYLRAMSQALLIKDIVITPYDGYYFLPAMEAAGLTGAAAAGGADPDGDGVPNVLEHAFGLNAAKPDAAGVSSGTGRYGLPEVFTRRNPETGLDHLAVRWRGRLVGAEYRVETAGAAASGEPLHWAHDPGGWGDYTEVPGAPDWIDHVWSSSVPLGANGPRFVRVRAYAQ